MIEGKIMQIPMMRGRQIQKVCIRLNICWLILGFEGRLGKFEVSPDGSLIVFINRNGQLHFVSAKVNEMIFFEFNISQLFLSSQKN